MASRGDPRRRGPGRPVVHETAARQGGAGGGDSSSTTRPLVHRRSDLRVYRMEHGHDSAPRCPSTGIPLSGSRPRMGRILREPLAAMMVQRRIQGSMPGGVVAQIRLGDCVMGFTFYCSGPANLHTPVACQTIRSQRSPFCPRTLVAAYCQRRLPVKVRRSWTL